MNYALNITLHSDSPEKLRRRVAEICSIYAHSCWQKAYSEARRMRRRKYEWWEIEIMLEQTAYPEQFVRAWQITNEQETQA